MLNDSDSIGSILSNVQIAGISFQCNPVILTVTSQIYDTSYALIPDVLQAQNLTLSLVIESSFELSLTFSGFLLLAGEPVELEMTRTHNGFQIRSDFSIPSISIWDIASDFTSLSLPLPDSSTAGQSFKLVGNFDDFRNGVIVIGTALNSNDQAFIILKKENDTLQIALTADVNSFLLRDLIQNTANQDISSIPYFGSLMIPELGVAVSSGPITSDLIQLCFDNTILLSCYGD